MKQSKNKDTKTTRLDVANKHRPEIRDDLDSREGEEQQFKGDDVTHNKKDVHNQGKKKNKSR